MYNNTKNAILQRNKSSIIITHILMEILSIYIAENLPKKALS